ncbi:hypothetical protein ACIA8I_13100 [Streptomyces rishiriensis]
MNETKAREVRQRSVEIVAPASDEAPALADSIGRLPIRRLGANTHLEYAS